MLNICQSWEIVPVSKKICHVEVTFSFVQGYRTIIQYCFTIACYSDNEQYCQVKNE